MNIYFVCLCVRLSHVALPRGHDPAPSDVGLTDLVVYVGTPSCYVLPITAFRPTTY